jgi:hypothetical protein
MVLDASLKCFFIFLEALSLTMLAWTLYAGKKKS